MLEMPLVVRHLVPTVLGAGPKKDRYPVDIELFLFVSTGKTLGTGFFHFWVKELP